MLYDDQQFTIESGLLACGVEWKDFAKLVFESLSEEQMLSKLEQLDPKFKKRFVIWKKYRTGVLAGKIKEPILPVLGAVPCVGKTTIARELSTRLGIGIVMGGDAFRAALRDFVDKDTNPAFFTSVYDAYKIFGEKNRENMLKGFDAQAKPLNRAMERIVSDRGVRDGESIVAEFLHFMPSQWDKEVLEHPAIIPMVLRLDSEAEHKKRIHVRDSTTHLKGNGLRFLEILDIYRLFQEHQTKDAKKQRVLVVSTDNMEKAMDLILDAIFERIEYLIKIKHAQPIKKVEALRKEREHHKTK